jgi:hypothetical protein
MKFSVGSKNSLDFKKSDALIKLIEKNPGLAIHLNGKRDSAE